MCVCVCVCVVSGVHERGDMLVELHYACTHALR